MAQGIDLTQLRALKDRLDGIVRDIPGERMKLHMRLGELAKKTVDSNIDSSLNDSRGKIKGWQELSFGSGGGYAAVRPVGGVSGVNSPGAITNYLESGHRQTKGRFVPAIGRKLKRHAVAGRGFYAKSRIAAEGLAEGEARRYANWLEARIRG